MRISGRTHISPVRRSDKRGQAATTQPYIPSKPASFGPFSDTPTIYLTPTPLSHFCSVQTALIPLYQRFIKHGVTVKHVSPFSSIHSTTLVSVATVVISLHGSIVLVALHFLINKIAFGGGKPCMMKRLFLYLYGWIFETRVWVIACFLLSFSLSLFEVSMFFRFFFGVFGFFFCV